VRGNGTEFRARGESARISFRPTRKKKTQTKPLETHLQLRSLASVLRILPRSAGTWAPGLTPRTSSSKSCGFDGFGFRFPRLSTRK
jgi:hypothetical protein